MLDIDNQLNLKLNRFRYINQFIHIKLIHILLLFNILTSSKQFDFDINYFYYQHYKAQKEQLNELNLLHQHLYYNHQQLT